MSVKLTLTGIFEPKLINTINGQKETQSVKAQEYNGNFLSWFVDEESRVITKDWKVGQVVEVEDVVVKEKSGKVYHNIYFRPKKPGMAEALQRLEKLENAMSLVKLKLKEIEGLVKPPKDDYPTDGGTPDEIDRAFAGEDDGLDQLKDSEIPF